MPSMSIPAVVALAILVGGTGCSKDPGSRTAPTRGKDAASNTRNRPRPKPLPIRPEPVRPARKAPTLDLGAYGPAPVVELQTSQGSIELTLFADKAPRTVQTILAYCKDGFYEGTHFHKVIPGYYILAGGKIMDDSGQLSRKNPTYANIPSEATNKLPKKRGAVLMSRGKGDPDSATCQFFILLKDKTPPKQVEGRKVRRKSPDYTVFGQVTKGLDVVDRIAALPTIPASKGIFKNPPVIRKVVVKEEARKKEERK